MPSAPAPRAPRPPAPRGGNQRGLRQTVGGPASWSTAFVPASTTAWSPETEITVHATNSDCAKKPPPARPVVVSESALP